MQQTGQEIEAIILQALSHDSRRAILRIVNSSENGASYTELISELGLPTGQLNYHLKQLEGLIEKNTDRRYVLTPLGTRALSFLNAIGADVSEEDRRYVKVARLAQRSSLQPTVRLFLFLGLVMDVVFLMVWGTMAYIALTEGAPAIVFIILPVLIAIGVLLFVALVSALRKTPEWVRRLEKRFFA